ncbi:hypothetical protein FRB98_001820 [Tulasnella sp. 332]|nr:hypothetical protein FRB98_001820 [Tulasnella sp. 332]
MWTILPTLEGIFDTPNVMEFNGCGLTSILLLAVKYNMKRIVKWATPQLERKFPHSDFSSWKARGDRLTSPIEVAHLITGCRALGFINILLTAFYYLVTYNWEERHTYSPEEALSLLSTEDRNPVSIERLRLLSDASTIAQELSEYGLCRSNKCFRNCDHSLTSLWDDPPIPSYARLLDPEHREPVQEPLGEIGRAPAKLLGLL